jgi:hypothetical protein
MEHEELSGLLLVGGYLICLGLTIKAFGIRRVLMFFVMIVVIGVSIGMGSLRSITDRR